MVTTLQNFRKGILVLVVSQPIGRDIAILAKVTAKVKASDLPITYRVLWRIIHSQVCWSAPRLLSSRYKIGIIDSKDISKLGSMAHFGMDKNLFRLFGRAVFVYLRVRFISAK